MSRGVARYNPSDLQYYVVTPAGWGEETRLPLVQTPDARFWWPVHACCEVLGVVAHVQLDKLQTPRYVHHLEDFSLQTASGIRPAKFLAFEALGEWLLSIQLHRISKPDVRERIQRFQAAALKAINDILVGKVQPVPLRLTGPSQAPRVTAQDAYALAAHTEQRLMDVEAHVFGQGAPYVNQHDDPGIINVPFHCPGAGDYVIRLRNVPWSAPEVVEIVAER